MNNKLKIVEGVAGVWHYHLSTTGENYKPALCGKVEVMRTEIPLTAWGIKSHLNESYCKECEQLAGEKLKPKGNNMIRKVYDKPRGILPRATGLPDMELKLGKRTKRDLLSKYSILGYFYKRAVANPGVTQFEYTEENGYEYERRATYLKATKTILTNDLACPVAHGHHIGSTCSMCGLKD